MSRSSRFTPKRYQLNKEAARIALSGHPWIFRTHLSSAAQVFPDGQWLQLVDHANETVGYGIYQAEGLIGVRVLGDRLWPPDREAVSKALDWALERRRHLRIYTNAFRALHGENDGFPGVVADVYGDTLILQTYTGAVDTFGRHLGARIAEKLNLPNRLWKTPTRRRGGRELPAGTRVLAGSNPGILEVREGKLVYSVDLAEGQKSGAFLDLRGLRKWIALQKWAGKRVLNLFSYTCTLGLAAEAAGAREVWNVDISPGALEFGKRHNARKSGVQRWVAADVFEWIRELPPQETFDVLIVDPPSMASRTAQVPKALAAYRKLYRSVIGHARDHAILIGACCTSRITRAEFRRTVDGSVGRVFRYKTTLQPEDDHPVGFPEGDYLKILVYER